MYHSDSRIPCLSCDSTRLTIPCSENLVGIVERLLDRGVEVVSASCNLHDAYDDTGYIGKTVQIQIELGYLYNPDIFDGLLLPPDWLIYEYHTVEEHNKIGPRYTGLCHSEQFTLVDDDDDELEFATALTIGNLELSLDNTDVDSYRAMWQLGGYL